jgi:2-phospho-L-lactate guanylyltransferase (CobY/MobA/RfbA family)
VVTVVVPFRGASAKSRLARPEVAQAMLDDVVRAAREVGEVVVANGDGGQGPAVAAALAQVVGPVLVVNADVPCVTGDDLRQLLAATPEDGAAIVAAADGTTNAISLAHGGLFEPLYGDGSARRFGDAGAVTVSIANLEDDVDTAEDLERVRDRVGPSTRAAL